MTIKKLFDEILENSTKTRNNAAVYILYYKKFESVFPKIIQYCYEKGFEIKQYCDYEKLLSLVFKQTNVENFYDEVTFCISERRQALDITFKFNNSTKTTRYHFRLYEMQDIVFSVENRDAIIHNAITPLSKKDFLSDLLENIENEPQCWLLLNNVMIYER